MGDGPNNLGDDLILLQERYGDCGVNLRFMVEVLNDTKGMKQWGQLWY